MSNVNKIDWVGDVRVAFPLFQKDCIIEIPSSPLKLIIEETNLERVIELNILWHSSLPRVSFKNIIRSEYKVYYWAHYKNIIYAVALWTSSIGSFKKYSEILELRRLAISDDAPKFTASRMLSVMIKMIKIKFPQIKRLISYQDMQAHNGIIYKAANWRKTSIVKADIWNRSRPDRNKPQIISKKTRWEYLIK